MAHIFVTGGNGFVGKHLVSYLQKKHHTVIIGSRENHTDFADTPAMDRLFKKNRFDYVFHLAAAGTRGKHDGGEDLVQTNIRGTFNFISLLRKYPVKGFLHTGSSSEYGVRTTKARECDALEPTFTFAGVKAASTMVVTAMAHEYNLPIITVRPFALYGPNDQPDRFIPTLIHSAIHDIPITVYPGVHDWIYVTDLVLAMTQLIMKAEKYRGQIFNVGTGISTDNISVVKTLQHITAKPITVIKKEVPYHQYDNNRWIADTRKLKKIIDWNPITFKEGLSNTLMWYKRKTDNLVA